LNHVSKELADLVSQRAQLLSAISQLQRKRAVSDKERVAEMQARLARVEETIEARRKVFLTLSKLAATKPTEEEIRRIYLFGCRELPPSYTKSAGYKCPVCGKTIFRSKKEIDLGAGIKLIGLSCECRSIAIPRGYSYPSEQVWGELIEKDKA
jgi:hypothetical protein